MESKWFMRYNWVDSRWNYVELDENGQKWVFEGILGQNLIKVEEKA